MHMRLIVRVAILVVAAVSTSPAFAEWMGQADFSACPRQYIPQTSGSEGPFPTQAACAARVTEVQQARGALGCARYACNEVAGSTVSSISPNVPLPSGLTPQQSMAMGAAALGGYMIGKGLHDLLVGNPQQQAEDQGAEAARQAQVQQQQEQRQQQQRQEQQRRDEATKQELLRSLKGTGSSADLAFKNTGAGAELQFKTGESAPAAPAVIHEGFSLPPLEPSSH
jgi:hypothetical protein